MTRIVGNHVVSGSSEILLARLELPHASSSILLLAHRAHARCCDHILLPHLNAHTLGLSSSLPHVVTHALRGDEWLRPGDTVLQLPHVHLHETKLRLAAHFHVACLFHGWWRSELLLAGHPTPCSGVRFLGAIVVAVHVPSSDTSAALARTRRPLLGDPCQVRARLGVAGPLRCGHISALSVEHLVALSIPVAAVHDAPLSAAFTALGALGPWIGRPHAITKVSRFLERWAQGALAEVRVNLLPGV